MPNQSEIDKFRILVIAHEGENREQLIQILESDYAVVASKGDSMALDLAQPLPLPSAIVFDFTIPVCDGFEIIRELKANSRTSSIPLIVIGVSGDSDDISRCYQLGVDDFLTAPADLRELRYRLQAVIAAEARFRSLHESVRSGNREVRYAQSKLEKLIQIGIEMGRERDRIALLRKILFGGREIAHCMEGTLYLKTKQQTLKFALRTRADNLPDFEVPLYDPGTGAPMEGYVSSYACLRNETVVIDDVYQEKAFDLSGTIGFSEQSGFRSVSLLTVPLAPRAGKVIGVLQFLNAIDPDSGEVTTFKPDVINFVEGLAAQAAVALDNYLLVESQKELMDSLIKLIAGAIDTKSPYTGGHCDRVPELAMMLAEEASRQSKGPFADFGFQSEDEWREFRIGAWLHDCGKVTTPEYVVDKATKLETVHNRIHEIRTRFEVLLRDADIERLKAIHERGIPRTEAEAAFLARKQQLTEDFALIAESNVGTEFTPPETIARIRQIGAQIWLRNFDDRLGLSHEELKRYQNEPLLELPAEETLLADKSHHLRERTDMKVFDQQYAFRMAIPKYLYNHGELHNLAISRGTLCDEERFKINEHIIQTIIMLEQLPLPENLKRVPEYAGSHHETLIGSGYPRKLVSEQLSIPARIMAIADIFEALTASDRPYKTAKSLSEAVKILHFFKKDQHIDKDLFDLFLTSGVYLRYAERFLSSAQIDPVDIHAYLG